MYAADGEVLPELLKRPSILHWLEDPEQIGKEALYVGKLGLPGGMLASKRVLKASVKDLKRIGEAASNQNKMGRLRRALAGAREGEDFSQVYEEVFGAGSSEQGDLAIFDLTVEEVRGLPGYKEILSPPGLEQESRNVLLTRSAGLAKALYAPADSERHQAACRVLKSGKYSMAYREVLPLTAGLLYKNYVDGKDGGAYGLHVFWRYVLSDPQDLVGIHQIVLNMRCMEVCGGDAKGALEKLHKPILDEITSWVLAAWHVEVEEGVTPALLPVLKDVWCTCPCVLSYGPLVQGVLNKLAKWKKGPQTPEQRAATLLTLARLLSSAWPWSVREAVLDYMLANFKDEQFYAHAQAGEVLSAALGGGGLSESQEKLALEALTGLCRDKEGYVRATAALELSKVLTGGLSEIDKQSALEALCVLCRNSKLVVREPALKGLSEVMGQEKSACAVLISLSKNESSQVRAAAAAKLSTAVGGRLSEIGFKSLVDALCMLCQDEYASIRSASVRGLSRALRAGKFSGSAFESLVQVLVSLCKDQERVVQSEAVEGLSRALTANLPESAIRSLMEVLLSLGKDENRYVRLVSARSLPAALGAGQLLSEDRFKSLVQALISLFSDEDWSVRSEAVLGLPRALKSGFSDGVIKLLIEALLNSCQDEYEYVQLAAVKGLSEALEAIELPEGVFKSLVKTLIGLCRDKGWPVRSVSAESLSTALRANGLSNNAFKSLVEALISLCRDENRYVQLAAVEGLSQALKSRSLSKVQFELLGETLISLCKDNNEFVRCDAARLLSEVGIGELPGDVDKVLGQVLRRLCRDTSLRVRQVTYDALGRLLCSGHDVKVLQQAFAALSKSCSYTVWHIPGPVYKSLCELLFGSSVNARLRQEGWHILHESCGDRDSSVRQLAVGSLSKALLEGELLANQFQSMMQALIRLRDPNCHVRSQTAKSLPEKAATGGFVESQEKLVLGALKNLCKDEEKCVSEAALKTLFVAIRKGRLSIEALVDLCKDKDEHIRCAAAEALSKALEAGKLSEVRVKSVVEALVGFLQGLNYEIYREADQALTQVMQHQDLLVQALMTSTAQRSWIWDFLSASPTLVKFIATYGPCLVLPETCDAEVSRRIKRYFTQERKARGWPVVPKALGMLKQPLPLKPRASTTWLVNHSSWVEVADRHDLGQSVLGLNKES